MLENNAHSHMANIENCNISAESILILLGPNRQHGFSIFGLRLAQGINQNGSCKTQVTRAFGIHFEKAALRCKCKPGVSEH
ncbi:hypothetical protein CLV88_10512 [Shimia abyssi]|uniref:Uncharacterized protein n=1 Tax=Shimia abyssi TaxID=1662395 RepID=A0A2P8FCZ5_9RHOB|nr:hypothetical protein CLV88_10512 [Shimia abyssi]